MKKNKVFKFIKSYSLVTLGLFINVFGWVAFLIPAEIVGGGVSGLSTIIYYATGFPVGISILIINAVLVLLAMKILGAKFGITSIYGIVVISLLFIILPEFITEPLITDRFMSALIGGGLCGVGIGIAFSNGGNSGGTDIIALIINKYRNISPGKIILYIDVVIIASSFLISQNIETVVYGYVVMGVFAYTLEFILEGNRQSYQLTIMSNKSSEIADIITQEVGRGVTILKGIGWFSQKEINVMLIIIRKHDKNKILRIISEIDEKAFTSQSKVTAVFGENFGKIKF